MGAFHRIKTDIFGTRLSDTYFRHVPVNLLSSHMLIELAKGVTFLLALSLLHNFILRKWRQNEPISQVLSGLLFGGICVIGMMTPIQFSPGVIFDARSVVLAMAGLFGGPTVGVIAGIIAGGYRLWLGGGGAGAGVGVIVTCVALGLVYRQASRRGWITTGLIQFLGFGLIVHLVTVAWFLLLRSEIVDDVMNNVAVPFVVTFTFATAILGGLLQDIENRLQTAEALRDSENRYRSIVENSPVCIHEIESSGRLLSINKSGLGMLGETSEKDIRGTNYLGYVADAEKDRVRKFLDRAFLGEESEFEFTSAGNVNPRVFSSCFIPLKNSGGVAEKIMGITEDITERKRAEEMLHRSRDDLEVRVEERTRDLSKKTELLQATLSNIEGGLVAFDAQGRMLTWNERYFEIFGMPDRFRRTGLDYAEIAKFDAGHGLIDHDIEIDSLIE